MAQERRRHRFGDIIAEIETDKATMEFEAVDEGILGKILIDEGSEGVKVNTPIAVMIEEGESAEDIEAASSGGASGGDDSASEEPPAQTGEGRTQGREGRNHLCRGRGQDPRPDRSPDWPEGTEMKQQTVREALRDAMAEEMRRDDTVFLMGRVGEYQRLQDQPGSAGRIRPEADRRHADLRTWLHRHRGRRLFGGLFIVEFMTFNFAMQAMDQIINSAAKTLYVRRPDGRADGVPRRERRRPVAAQHSQDYAVMVQLGSRLKVVMPYTAADAKGLLKTAIRDPNPVIFLENEILYGRSFDVPDLEDFTIPFGKARIAREGKDVTIVSFGIGMAHLLEAADKLAEDGSRPR